MDDMVSQAGRLQSMSWSLTCALPHSRISSNSAIGSFLSRRSYSSLTSWYVVVLSPLPLFYLWKHVWALLCLVHCDIQPANFVMGTGHRSYLVNDIDLALQRNSMSTMALIYPTNTACKSG